MEQKIIKIIVLMTGKVLISEIQEVPSDIGEPDCKLINPYVVVDEENQILHQFLIGVTKQTSFMISSDKILTLAEPKATILEKYQTITE